MGFLCVVIFGLLFCLFLFARLVFVIETKLDNNLNVCKKFGI